MNFAALKYGVRTFAKHSKVVLVNNAPKILVGTGIGLGVATVATACTATLKCNDILKEQDELLAMPEAQGEEQQKIIRKGTRRKLIKACIKPAGLGVASVTCTLLGMRILNGRAVKAIAAASAATSQLNDLHENIVDAFGPEIDQKLRKGLPISKDEAQKAVEEAEKKIEERKEKRKKREKVQNSNAYFEDDSDGEFMTFNFSFCEEECSPRFGHPSGRWSPYSEKNYNTIRAIYGALDNRLRTTGKFTVNDFMDEVGHERLKTKRGECGLIFDKKLGVNDLDQFTFGIDNLLKLESPEYADYMRKAEPNIELAIRVRKRPLHEYYDDFVANGGHLE